MILTTAVCSTVMFDQTVADYVFAHPAVQLLSLILPLIGTLARACLRSCTMH
jgi:hypothetical protein